MRSISLHTALPCGTIPHIGLKHTKLINLFFLGMVTHKLCDVIGVMCPKLRNAIKGEFISSTFIIYYANLQINPPQIIQFYSSNILSPFVTSEAALVPVATPSRVRNLQRSTTVLHLVHGHVPSHASPSHAHSPKKKSDQDPNLQKKKRRNRHPRVLRKKNRRKKLM